MKRCLSKSKNCGWNIGLAWKQVVTGLVSDESVDDFEAVDELASLVLDWCNIVESLVFDLSGDADDSS